MCRLLPATTIGEAVYGDEMSDFECVTTQPGCRQVCYNQFSPMTHTRFWSMHILILSFPPILYSFIAANFNAKYTILQKRLTEEIESNDNRFETFTSFLRLKKLQITKRERKRKCNKQYLHSKDLLWFGQVLQGQTMA